MAFNTMGRLSSGSVLDLGLGTLTQEELQQQEIERRKKKQAAVANTNPGVYGDASASASTKMLFGLA